LLGQHVIGALLPNQAWAVAPACLGSLHHAVTVRAAKKKGPENILFRRSTKHAELRNV